MVKAKSLTGRSRRIATVRSATYHYTALFEPAEEGGYVVHIPALGIATQGEDLNDARAMAEGAIRGYLECLREHGEEIPTEGEEAVTARIAGGRGLLIRLALTSSHCNTMAGWQ
ncbi:MAG: type II toxin-antitoxin system HicB family antitoxin [Candidatus Binatia bacterium]